MYQELGGGGTQQDAHVIQSPGSLQASNRTEMKQRLKYVIANYNSVLEDAMGDLAEIRGQRMLIE